MNMRQYCVVSGALFLVVAVAHLLRLALALPVRVDEFIVPLQVSWAGAVVPAILAYQAFRLARQTRSG